MTASSGVTDGFVRYLCFMNTVSLMRSALGVLDRILWARYIRVHRNAS